MSWGAGRRRGDVGRRGDGPGADAPGDGVPVADRSRPLLLGLTGVRGFAAVLVVLHHLVPVALPHPWLRGATAVLYAGIGFFFVLSGAVLAFGWRPEHRVRHFYVRRLARIFPLHVLTWLIALATVAGTGGLAAVLGLLLLQAWVPDASYYYGGNSLAWSLSTELFAYLCFPLLVAPARRMARAPWRALAGLLAAYLGLVALVASTTQDPELLDGLLYVHPVPRLLQFVAGMVVGFALADGWRPRLVTWQTSCLLAAVWTGVTALNGVLLRSPGLNPFAGEIGLPRYLAELLVLPFVVVAVLAVARDDQEGRRTPISRPVWLLLGQWSLALYLWHQLFFRLVADALDGVDVPAAAGPVLFVGLLVAAVGLSAGLHVVVERPAERYLRERYAPRAALPPRPEAPADLLPPDRPPPADRPTGPGDGRTGPAPADRPAPGTR